MLAVLEHIPRGQQGRLVLACARLLKPGGHLVVTIPSPAVDGILHFLQHLKLVHGMEVEEHYGFAPAEALALFSTPEFRLLRRRRFQLGLNNLFVFERTG